MQEKITHEELSEVLDRTTAWIENCDSKASTVLGVAGVAASILLATDYVEKIYSIYKYMLENISGWSLLYLISSFLSTGACILGCALLVGVLIGRVNTNDYSQRGIQTDSLLFFATISQNNDLTVYKEKLIKCTPEQLHDDLVSQIYICSIICEKKFCFYKKGLIISFVGFIVFLITVIIGIIVV